VPRKTQNRRYRHPAPPSQSLLGPYLIGLLAAKTHRFDLALMVTAAAMILGAFTCVLGRKSMAD
jgi:hypothetical protein